MNRAINHRDDIHENKHILENIIKITALGQQTAKSVFFGAVQVVHNTGNVGHSARLNIGAGDHVSFHQVPCRPNPACGI